MKFISKSENYRIMLRPGISGNAMLGNPPQPGLHVKFEDGVAHVNDEETIRLMKLHPAFDKDFISAEGGNSDSYGHNRKSSEPLHTIEEMDHGVMIRKGDKPKPTITPEQKKLMSELIEQGIKDGIEKALKNQKAIKNESDKESVEESIIEDDDSAEEETKNVTKKKTTQSKQTSK